MLIYIKNNSTDRNYKLFNKANINGIISDLETPAFGYDKKLIIAKNTGLFKKDLKKGMDIVKETM